METVNIELDGQIYKINIAKLICEINELDKAWQSVANRRMKKGKNFLFRIINGFS